VFKPEFAPVVVLDIVVLDIVVLDIVVLDIVVLGAVTPDVNGAEEAELAPPKATDWVDAVGLGVAIMLLGLRTLSCHISTILDRPWKRRRQRGYVPINHVNDTIRNQHIGRHDLRAVYKYASILNCDRHVATRDRFRMVLLSTVLYPTVPCTAWYSRMPVNCCADRVPADSLKSGV
jgi:hypothetical protein